MKLAADGLRSLCEFADPHAVNAIVTLALMSCTGPTGHRPLATSH